MVGVCLPSEKSLILNTRATNLDKFKLEFIANLVGRVWGLAWVGYGGVEVWWGWGMVGCVLGG